MSETVLILGAGGFIGSHFAEMLARSGHMVIAATRRTTNFTHPDIRNVTAEFSHPAQFVPLLDMASWVVHSASSSTPSTTAGHPLAEIDGNLRTTLSLLEALQEFPQCNLLFLSSGGTVYGDHRFATADESACLRPRSYHGAGKAAAEQFIHAWAAQNGRTAVSIRPSNVYGPGQQPNKGFGIIPAALDHILHTKPLTIWGDGTSVRDYLYIDDLADLLFQVLKYDFKKEMHLYNASAGVGFNLNDLLNAIDSATGEKLQRLYGCTRKEDVHRTVPDHRAALKTFGWRAQTPLELGLKKTWHWYRETHGSELARSV